MMGTDQDDVLLAPWTTVKYRVSSTTVTNSSPVATASLNHLEQVNSLNNLYPGLGGL